MFKCIMCCITYPCVSSVIAHVQSVDLVLIDALLTLSWPRCR